MRFGLERLFSKLVGRDPRLFGSFPFLFAGLFGAEPWSEDEKLSDFFVLNCSAPNPESLLADSKLAVLLKGPLLSFLDDLLDADAAESPLAD